MKTTQNTILITGGGSGIGLEMARIFTKKGNTVIITGRNENKLRDAVIQLGQDAHYIVADVTNDDHLDALDAAIKKNFPTLNILINNAGQATLHNIGKSPDAARIAKQEIETNYLAPVKLTARLLELLSKAPEAAIVNISSIVAFAPGLSLPTYSASKAALHSYTQTLRLSLSDTTIKVFEVMPPLVDTDFAKDIASDAKISPAQVAEDLVTSMATNNYEVHVASTEQLYKNFLGRPDKATLALNGLPLQ
ncbi:MAG TPA: SDR family NAD(P)-dependent oxidoreductase [Chryseosolibacter sp.]